MKTFFDCIPCFLRQALDSARLVSDDESLHERVLREVLRQAGDMDLHAPPPVMGRDIHRLIRRLVGSDDPYRDVKRRSNALALRLYPTLRRRVQRSAEPLETAARLAIAGNIIDASLNGDLTEPVVRAAIEQSLSDRLEGDPQAFQAALAAAGDILYLTDNAGEIVFDRLLIEQMPAGKVTVAVRGAPTINDATLADARAAGLHEVADVIDNGSDVPGTILNECGPAFRARFERADLIVAKGQGNYETLSECPRPIWYLLKAKCPVIARDLGCELGSLILRNAAGPPGPCTAGERGEAADGPITQAEGRPSGQMGKE